MSVSIRTEALYNLIKITMDNEIKAAIQIQKIIRGFLTRQRLYALYPKYLIFASKKTLKTQNFLEDRFTIITNFSNSNNEIKAKPEISETSSEKNKTDQGQNFNPNKIPKDKHEKQNIIEISYDLYSETKTTIGILILKAYKEVVKPLSDLEIIKHENDLEESSKSYSEKYEKSLDENSNSHYDEDEKSGDVDEDHKSSEGLILKKLSESNIEKIDKEDEGIKSSSEESSEKDEDLQKSFSKSNSLEVSGDEMEMGLKGQRSESLNNSVDIKSYHKGNEKIEEKKRDEGSSDVEKEVENKDRSLDHYSEKSIEKAENEFIDESGKEKYMVNEKSIENKDEVSEEKNERVEDKVMNEKEKIIINRDDNSGKSGKSADKDKVMNEDEKENDVKNGEVGENKDEDSQENNEKAEVVEVSEKSIEKSEDRILSEKENQIKNIEFTINKDHGDEKNIVKKYSNKDDESEKNSVKKDNIKDDESSKNIVKKDSTKVEKSFEENKSNEKNPKKESLTNKSLESEKKLHKNNKEAIEKKDEKLELSINKAQSSIDKQKSVKSPEKVSFVKQSSISGSSNPTFKPKHEKKDSFSASIPHTQSIKKKNSNIPKKNLDISKESISKPNEKSLEKISSSKGSLISKKQEAKPQFKEEKKSINDSIVSHKSNENIKAKIKNQENKDTDLEIQAKNLALLSSEDKNSKPNLPQNPLSEQSSHKHPSLLSLPKPTDEFMNPLLPEIYNQTPPINNTSSLPQITPTPLPESKPQDHENSNPSSPFPQPVDNINIEKSEISYESLDKVSQNSGKHKSHNSSYKGNTISIKTPLNSSDSSVDSKKSLKRLESDKTQKNSTPKSKRPSGSFVESADKKSNEESKRLSQNSQGSCLNRISENSLEIKNELRVHESFKSESSDKTMKFDGKIEKFSPDFKGKLSHSSSFSKSSYKESQKNSKFIRNSERSFENIVKASENFDDSEKGYESDSDEDDDENDDRDLEKSIYIKQQTAYAHANIEASDICSEIGVLERNSMEIQNSLPFIESHTSHPNQKLETKNKKSKVEIKPSEKPQMIKNTRKKLGNSKYTQESKSHTILPTFVPSKTSEKFEISHKNEHIPPTSYSKTTSFAPSQLSHLPNIGKDDSNKAPGNFPNINTKKNQPVKQESKIKLNKIIQLSGRAETKFKKAEKIDKNPVFDIKPPAKRASSKQNFKISPRTADDVGKAFHVIEKHVEITQKNPYDVGWSQKLFKKFFNLNIKIDQNAAALPKLKLIKIRRDNIKNLLKNNK